MDLDAGFCLGRSEETEEEDEEYEYVYEETEVEEEIEVEIDEEVEAVAEPGERPYEDEESMERSNEDEDIVEEVEDEVDEVAGEVEQRRLTEVSTGSKHVDGSSISSSAHNPQPSSSADTERSCHTMEAEPAGTSATDPQTQASMPQNESSSKDVHKRSTEMKQFEAALIDFFKGFIRPFWHKGNMTKEAYKTIVKKSVDKVVITMKADQIPGTDEEVKQYISSYRKSMAKVIEGYIGKYGKSGNSRAVA